MIAPSNPMLEREVARVMNVRPRDEQLLPDDIDNQAELVKRFNERKLVAESITEELLKSLKPKGFYNIPDILDEKRLYYAIPNGAFESQPLFDKVYIYQIPVKEGNTFTNGGMIVMPDQTIAYKRNTAPRGIIVAAGLKAMDSIYSTGCAIGHTVRFKKFAPFIQPVAEIKGHELTVMVIRDGDLVSSEDMSDQIHSREGEIKNISSNSYDFRYFTSGQMSGEKIADCYDESV